MIRVIDYGVGNVQAFLNLFNRVGLSAERAKNVDDLADASHLILPGVGHFDYAMRSLNNSGMRECLEDLVVTQKVPILGVCVGMQMLANSSEEGDLPGLGWLPGCVQALAGNYEHGTLPLPHMGWNELQINTHHGFFPSVASESPQFYFLHSFYFSAKNKSEVIATANYGFDFDAVVCNGNVFGMQCHPEKSHIWGEHFLRAFAEQ